MNIKKGLFYFFICFNLIVYAQDFTQNVKGKVVDSESKLEIPGVMVQLLSGDSSNIVFTDIFGYFTLKNVPVGRVDIRFTFMGYSPVLKRSLIVNSGKELIVDVALEEAVTSLEAVKIAVVDNRLKANNEAIVASNIKLNPKQTQKFAGTNQDVSRMASNYAGVVPSGDQRNDIIVRGNSPLGIIWRLDGVNIPNPNHFGSMGATGGPISILNNNNLSGSDFLTGAFPAEYGNGIAGAFDLKMRSGNKDKFEFTGQMGFNGLEVGLEGPLSKKNKASYVLNYRYSTLGIFNAMGISFGVPAVPQYQDVAFKIDLPTKGKFGRFQLFGIGGVSFIELLDSQKEDDDWTFTSSGTDVRFGTNVGVVGLNHRKFLNNKTYWSNTVSVTSTQNDITSDSLESVTLLPFRTYKNLSTQISYALNSVLNSKINSKKTIKMGVNTELIGADFKEEFYSNNRSEWLPIVDFKGSTVLVQSFFQYRYKPTEKLVVNTGIHHQILTLNNSQAIEPRLGLKYRFSKKQSFTLASGLHSQINPLRVYFLETNYVDGSSEKTNEDLGLNKSVHGVVGYNYMINPNLRFKTEAYYQVVYNTPTKEYSYYSLANVGGDFVFQDEDSLVNKGKGTNYGIEVTLEKMYSKGYYFLINTSIYDSKYQGGDAVIRNTTFNGKYTANLLGGYEVKITKRSVLTIDFKLAIAGGKRYLALDLEESKLQKKTVFDESSIYESKFDDYYRADLKLGFRLNHKKVTQEWALDIQNITNKKNIFREVFDEGSGDLIYEYQLGFFPLGYYKITF